MVETTAVEKIRQLLSAIPDPEIPVITIEELGVLRGIEINNNTVLITITPTYSGCPAMKQIEDDILAVLKRNGYEDVKIHMRYSPAWTTDWIPEMALEKLRAYGIAPPEKTTADKGVLMGKEKKVKCPRCGSSSTRMVSQFGSTACKALYQCEACHEPFDYFKCI